MGLLDERYIQGTTKALVDAGIVKTAKVEAVAKLAELKLRQKFTKSAMVDPSAQELNQVTQSGLTENDIQSAAKVVQVIAEMKQQADAAAMGMPQQPGAPGAAAGMPAQAPAGQPPMPPPPAGAQPGMMPPGGMPPGGMPPGAGGAGGPMMGGM